MPTVVLPASRHEIATDLARTFKALHDEPEHASAFVDILQILADDPTPEGPKLHAFTDAVNTKGHNLAVIDMLGYLVALQRAHIIKLVALDPTNEPHIQILRHDGCQA